MGSKSAKIQVKADGALVCPGCGKSIKGIRIYPDTQLSRANVRCSCCKRSFDLTITTNTGQRPETPSAIVHLL